jgi:pectinesterase
MKDVLSHEGKPLYDVTVALDGSGDFDSIQDAIENAPPGDLPYGIYIRNGIYRESFEIERPNLYLMGEDRDKTVMTAAMANGMLDEHGRRFATSGSRTLSINAPNVRVRSLTIQNSFDFPANQAKSDDDPGKVHHTQAVALLVASQGDRVQLKDVSLISYHDTLYLHAGRSYFDRTRITGTVDFIFGQGIGLFENCKIVARNRQDVAVGSSFGYIAAPSTNINQPFGLVFKHCLLCKEPEVPKASYGLGRPWHPTTEFAAGCYADPDAIGHTAFVDCRIDDHIYGWDKMSGKDKTGDTIWFYPHESRFWEYGNKGKGACPDHPQRPQLSAEQIRQYTPEIILSGWQPDISLGTQTGLRGRVLHQKIRFPTLVRVKDSVGQTVVTETDKQGEYHVSLASMTPPLLVSAGMDCDCAGLCIHALVVDVYNNQQTLADIDTVSDRIASIVFAEEGIDDLSLLTQQHCIPPLSRQAWQRALDNAEIESEQILSSVD